MIAALIVYSLAVTTLFAIAAASAEQLLRLSRRPTRAVWMIAMLGSLGISALRFQSVLSPRNAVAAPAQLPVQSIVDAPSSAAASLPVPGASHSVAPTVAQAPTLVDRARDAIARIGRTRVEVANDSMVTRFDGPLVLGWALLSVVGLLIIAWSAMRLARQRNWPATTIAGVPVFVSHDLGPAVIGLLRYRIVLPAWVLEMPSNDRDLILVHEREHAKAGDPTLLFAATVLVAVMPWNVALWWMARRLRYAIELDCDSRVLRNRPDPRAYGSLLLDVSERTVGGTMPVAALAEPVSLIERRITAMTARTPRFVAVRVAAAGVMAAALVAVACATPQPASVPSPANSPQTPSVSKAPPVSVGTSLAVLGGATPETRQMMMRDSLPARSSLELLADSVTKLTQQLETMLRDSSPARTNRAFVRDSLPARTGGALQVDSMPRFTSQAVPGAGQHIRFTSVGKSGPRRISAEFIGQQVEDILGTFSNVTGRSIVADPDVKGIITATVVDVPWDLALRTVLESNGFDLRETASGFTVHKKASRESIGFGAGAGSGSGIASGRAEVRVGSGGMSPRAGGYGSGGPLAGTGASLPNGAYGNPSGLPDSTYPRIMLHGGAIAATLERGSTDWAAAQRDTRVSVDGTPGTSAVASGGYRSQGSSASAGGYGVGGGVTDPATAASIAESRERIDRRSQHARQVAAQYYPEAFAVHDGELHEIVLIFDAGGTLIAKGTKARAPVARGESVFDREVMSRVMPGFSFNQLYEWGMSNVSTPRQAQGSGVVVFFGFTGKAPW